MFERRGKRRVNPQPGAPIEIQVMGNGFLEIVRATDISEQGVGFVLPHGLDGRAWDKDVELIITLPKERPFHTYGVIRRRESKSDCHVGVDFFRLSDKGLEMLRKYIASRS